MNVAWTPVFCLISCATRHSFSLCGWESVHLSPFCVLVLNDMELHYDSVSGVRQVCLHTMQPLLCGSMCTAQPDWDISSWYQSWPLKGLFSLFTPLCSVLSTLWQFNDRESGLGLICHNSFAQEQSEVSVWGVHIHPKWPQEQSKWN